MSNKQELPAPHRRAGRLWWDRHEIENYKRLLMGLAPVERDPNSPIVFVSARQLTVEIGVGRRSLGRYVRKAAGLQASPASVGATVA
jgi:hypothetical protein